jgi:branched-chain amino acid aminotransferase
MIKQPRFDNREGKIFLNNKFISWEDSKIHTLNHSLHYGSSCFEGIRIYNGKIFKNKEHAERLLFSASTLDLAPEFTPNQIRNLY